MKQILRQQEFYIGLLILILSISIATLNPKFLSIGNIYSIFKSTTIFGILSMGVLLVVISGGIDVSFPVVAAFTLYTTSLIVSNFLPNLPLIGIFGISASVGALCGLANGLLIAKYKFPAMVVTLGMSGALAGFMYSFIGTRINHDLSTKLIDFGKMEILQYTQADGVIVGLPVAYLLYILIAVVIWLVLKYTFFGRSIYAIGGDEISAERVGLNTFKIKVSVYIIVGTLAGIAGIIHSSFLRMANPFELYGTELTVIASTVLGGAMIGGGKGTVLGTFLGLLLVTIINNSLILLGVPSYWQKVVTGSAILLSIIVPQLIKNKLSQNKT